MLKSTCQDVLFPHYVSLVIYNFKCQCNTEYIVRTNQRLEVKIDCQLRWQYENFQALINTFGSVIAESDLYCLLSETFSHLSAGHIQTTI